MRSGHDDYVEVKMGFVREHLWIIRHYNSGPINTFEWNLYLSSHDSSKTMTRDDFTMIVSAGTRQRSVRVSIKI